jgi:hypothetical protein
MVKDLTRKPLYACTIWSEDFTRRFNANRHNWKIHSGKAEIVKFIDYYIGRLSGKYLPADPLSYRIKNRNKNKAATFVHEKNDENNNNLYHEKSDPSYMKTQPHITEPPSQNGIYDKNNNNFSISIGGIKTGNNPLNRMHYLNNLFRPSDQKAKELLQKQKIKDKIEDIKGMLCDFHPPEGVQILVAELNNRFNATTDYTAFNEELENYRNTLVDLYLGYANPFK